MSILATFHAVDLKVLYLINHTWSQPWLDPIMARVSDFGSVAKCLLALAVVLLLVFGRFRGRLFVVMMAVCLMVGDGCIDWAFKMSINRPRPSETEPGVRVLSVYETTVSHPHHVDKGRSFTSGHACNNFALAMMGCAIFGQRAAWLWVWALLVSYSRVYVGAHYPSDIVGSWLVSFIYSFLFLKAAEWLWQRYAVQCCPKLYEEHPLLFPAWARFLGSARTAREAS